MRESSFAEPSELSGFLSSYSFENFLLLWSERADTHRFTTGTRRDCHLFLSHRSCSAFLKVLTLIFTCLMHPPQHFWKLAKHKAVPKSLISLTWGGFEEKNLSVGSHWSLWVAFPVKVLHSEIDWLTLSVSVFKLVLFVILAKKKRELCVILSYVS